MAEKEELVPETPEEMVKWPLPFNIALEKLDRIVKAFFQAQADTKKVLANDLPGRTGLNPATIKANAKFLAAVGILKPTEEKNSYTLEPKGAEYAKALASNDEKQYSAFLKDILTNSFLKELIDYIELQGSGLVYEQLFQHIKTMARLKEDPKFGTSGIAAPYATGISTLIDLLCRAGIVSKEIMAKKETVKSAMVPRKSPQKVERKTLEEVTPEKKSIVESFHGNTTGVPFTVSISVEAKDPESIKQLINLVRELRGQEPAPS